MTIMLGANPLRSRTAAPTTSEKATRGRFTDGLFAPIIPYTGMTQIPNIPEMETAKGQFAPSGKSSAAKGNMPEKLTDTNIWLTTPT
jgi:hypothetical protein